jgi:5-methylthioadenosine/S-adenosylhomocysteine deaminase
MVRKNGSVDFRKASKAEGMSGNARRGFLKGSIGFVAGAAAAQFLPHNAEAQNAAAPPMGQTLRAANTSSRPILIKDGIVLSLDRQVGDFAKSDVLIQGKKIVSVGPNLKAPADAVVVNAAGLIVMPGFIDTHHHQYETVLRSMIADGMWGGNNDRLPERHYGSVIQQVFSPVYKPDDARVSELIASLSQMNDGVTTTVDTSQIQLTPEHTDACIAGLKESGRRCLFAYGAGGPNAAARNAPELARLQKQYFSSKDQLLTLAGSLGMNPDTWKIARDLGLPLVAHCQGGQFDEAKCINSKTMGPDFEYIHCTRIGKEMFDAIRDTGGHVSIATAIEMQMGHAHPPFQECLDRGIRPSLSVDVECNMTADSFTQMREGYTWQRAMVNERVVNGEQNVPPLVTSRDVIEFATIEGAKCAHIDSQVGTLTPGKEADIILLSTGLNVTPLNNVPGAIVTLMDTSNVESVFIAGKVMKWQGKMVGVDINKVLQEANKSAEGLIARSGYTNSMFDTCCKGPLLTAAQRAAIKPEDIKSGRTTGAGGN